ncbi:MAG: hypothetical protein Q8P82_02060 [bacterium]|nr:hypothetical protein [bacterium]
MRQWFLGVMLALGSAGCSVGCTATSAPNGSSDAGTASGFSYQFKNEKFSPETGMRMVNIDVVFPRDVDERRFVSNAIMQIEAGVLKYLEDHPECTLQNASLINTAIVDGIGRIVPCGMLLILECSDGCEGEDDHDEPDSDAPAMPRFIMD